MRRIFLTVIITLVLVAAGGAAAFWYAQASRARTNVEQWIAQFNTGPMKITYDTLDVSGFPFEIAVTLVNPHVSGRVDTLLGGKTKQGDALPQWDQDIKLAGAMRFSINALSDRYALDVTGNWHYETLINNQAISANSSGGDSHCVLEIARGANWFAAPWNFSALSGRGGELLNDFRLFDCNVAASTFTDAKTNAPLAQSGASRVYASNAIENNQRQIRFLVNMAGSEVTPEGDKIYSALAQAFTPPGSSLLLSAYGKQTFDIDFAYTGPEHWPASMKGVPVDIRLSKFNIHSDAYSASISGSLTASGTPENYSSRLVLKSESTYSEIYDALFRDVVRDTIRQMFTEKTPPRGMESTMAQHTPESFYALIAPVIPKLHELGKTVMAIDVGYQGHQDMNNGTITLSSLEISATPYGITAAGSAIRSPTSPIPSANLNINCNNCLQMLDDMAAYAGRIATTMSALKPGQPGINFDPQMVEGYKAFLSALAGSATPNLAFAIVSDGRGKFTINGKAMDEVLMLYHQYVTRAGS